jgi:hypothetical protein
LDRRAVALAELRLSATVGVGSSCPATPAKLGRRAAPSDGERFAPYVVAVGVGNSTCRLPPGSTRSGSP